MFVWLKDLYAEFTPRALKALVTVVALSCFGVYLFCSQSSAPTIASNKSDQAANTEITTPKIYVHIAGKVKNPGIYQLDSGSRVFDAVLLAGGFTAKANQSAVNLARVLNDGEQVVIGEGSKNSGSKETGLISLNQSSASTLEDLPGVGPALAGRIVDWRETNGGFQAKEDLLNVQGIGAKLFAGLKDLVTL